MTCVVAEQQTAGRGRFERSWISPKGNLYTTLVLFLEDLQLASHSGQIAALACIDGLKKLSIDAQIKWPNDLLLNGKKVGGILAETTSFKGQYALMIGIGINISTPKEEIIAVNPDGTSLAAEGFYIEKSTLLLLITETFITHLTTLKKCGFTPFIAPFNSHLAYIGKTLAFYTEKTSKSGTLIGVNEGGHLLLQQPDGTTIPIHSGESSKKVLSKKDLSS